MRMPKDDAETLAARWTEGVLLKRDVFSMVERGRFRGQGSEVDAVVQNAWAGEAVQNAVRDYVARTLKR